MFASAQFEDLIGDNVDDITLGGQRSANVSSKWCKRRNPLEFR